VCLIVARYGDGAKVDWGRVRKSAEVNSHGFGIAHPVNAGGLAVASGSEVASWLFPTVESLVAYARCVEARGVPFLVHLRFGTSGVKGRRNLQPFVLRGGRVAFAHNGVISTLSGTRAEWSDTRILAELLGTLEGETSWDVLGTMRAEQVLRAVGADGEKLAAIDAGGHVVLRNEELGDTEDGVWYSSRARSIGHVGGGYYDWMSGREGWVPAGSRGSDRFEMVKRGKQGRGRGDVGRKKARRVLSVREALDAVPEYGYTGRLCDDMEGGR